MVELSDSHKHLDAVREHRKAAREMLKNDSESEYVVFNLEGTAPYYGFVHDPEDGDPYHVLYIGRYDTVAAGTKEAESLLASER